MENINLSTTTDRHTITTLSTIPAPPFVIIGKSSFIAIDNHQYQSSAWIHHHSWTWPHSVVSSSVSILIGNSFVNQLPFFRLPIYTSLTPKYVSKDTCPKTVSTSFNSHSFSCIIFIYINLLEA
jgi:hypothetical protein